MTTEEPTLAVSAPTVASRALLPVYAATIFLSAALLFAVQPMFAKMVLPRLGGAPSVWSVAMVFFQGALLAGYAYAHALTRFLPGRGGIAVHVALMVVAAFALPLAIAAGWGKPPAAGEAFWLLGLFTASIGLPFFALSSNGPLLQAWFARTGHPAARDPYFLYAASNVGSFLALISYPAVVEPLVRLGDQTWLWSAGFYALILLIAACGLLLWRSPGRLPDDAATDAAAAPPSLRDAATWVAFAAVPSGLLVAVTAHISTDVAAVPLLWVLPLALYLATFVIVFSTRPVIPHWVAVHLQALAVTVLVGVYVLDLVKSIIWLVSLNVLVFFACALMCHGELARRRPAPRHLTAFYMWMSVGGMVGGLAAGLIAPNVFSWVMEYPILILLAVLCRPGLALPVGRVERSLWLVGIAAAAAALVAIKVFDLTLSEPAYTVTLVALVASGLLFWRKPLAFGAMIAFIFTAERLYTADSQADFVRSFFGVHKVSETADGRIRVLMHGTTIHGAEIIREDKASRPEHILYYYDGSAIAQAMAAARERAGRPIRYAVIGLGAGSLACRAEAGETVTYYEIDPAVVRIARDPDRFTYLSQCPADIVLGDARLTLAEAADGAYDLIIVDAFSSDAIPIHLMTREATAIYRKKLTANGIIVMHVSNRHLELASVVAGIAQANGLISRVNTGGDVTWDDDNYIFVGTVAAVARSDEDLGPLAGSQFWPLQQPDPRQWVWTDDYSNIVGSVIRKLRE